MTNPNSNSIPNVVHSDCSIELSTDKKLQRQNAEKIHDILEKRELLHRKYNPNFNDLEEAKAYMKMLLSSEYITPKQYGLIFLEAGLIRLGSYLILENVIDDKDLKKALNAQKNQETKKCLGEILVEQGLLDLRDLVEVLKGFGATRLGEYLVSEGLIDEGQLKTALERQKKMGKPLGGVLVALGMIHTDDLNRALYDLGITIKSYELSLDESY